MITFPNAKINLGLQVLRKRQDGFHDIETVFYPVSIHDSLEVIPSGNRETSIKLYGAEIPAGENLCVKAYHLLKNSFGLPPVEMHLIKQIPTGAGLGGGSSDASHALMMLNDLFGLNVNVNELESLALELGSDCAFFIQNKPVFATGRGEQLEEIQLDLSEYHIRIENPGIHISTPEAYGMVSPGTGRPSLREIINRPVSEWKDHLTNDFEVPIFERYPEIQQIKEKMYDDGALYASMSGSGSAVYGIFN